MIISCPGIPLNPPGFAPPPLSSSHSSQLIVAQWRDSRHPLILLPQGRRVLPLFTRFDLSFTGHFSSFVPSSLVPLCPLSCRLNPSPSLGPPYVQCGLYSFPPFKYSSGSVPFCFKFSFTLHLIPPSHSPNTLNLTQFSLRPFLFFLLSFLLLRLPRRKPHICSILSMSEIPPLFLFLFSPPISAFSGGTDFFLVFFFHSFPSSSFYHSPSLDLMLLPPQTFFGNSHFFAWLYLSEFPRPSTLHFQEMW